MNIAYDLTPALNTQGGISHYTRELALELNELLKDSQYNVDFFINDKNLLVNNINKWVVPFKNVKVIDSRNAGFYWIYSVTKYLKSNKYDLLISTSNFSFGILFSNTIQIVHDISPILDPSKYSIKQRFIFSLLLYIEVLRARWFLTISNETKKDFNKIFPLSTNKTSYIGTGIRSDLIESKGTKPIKKLPKKYILSVSSHVPRKNYIKMINIFFEVKKQISDLHYVIVGQETEHTKDIKELIQNLGISESVHLLGYVEDSEINYIYDNAELLLMLSQSEGFGIPLIEAYSRGLHSVISDIGIFREVMDNKATYVDIEDEYSVISKVIAMLGKKHVVNVDFLKKYDWNVVAGRLLQQIWQIIK